MYFRVIEQFLDVFLGPNTVVNYKLLCRYHHLINQVPESDKYLNSLKSQVVKIQDLNQDQLDMIVNAVFILGQQAKNIAYMVCVTKVSNSLLVLSVVFEI